LPTVEERPNGLVYRPGLFSEDEERGLVEELERLDSDAGPPGRAKTTGVV